MEKKNGPPRADGRGLCKMGAERPRETLLAVKSLASSSAFEKFTKKLKILENLHVKYAEGSMKYF